MGDFTALTASASESTDWLDGSIGGSQSAAIGWMDPFGGFRSAAIGWNQPLMNLNSRLFAGIH